jgi:RNA-binding protein
LELTGKQKRFLRSLGNKITATVSIGKMGVTENTCLSISNAFHTHELVKVKIQDGCEETKENVALMVERGTGGAVVQILGNTLLLYKRNHEKPKINLP